MRMQTTHINTGIRKILEQPVVYNFFCRITGENKRRAIQTKKYFKLNPGARILDIGCGTGTLLNFLPSNIEYFGFDMERRYIDFAKSKFGERGNFFLERVGEVLKSEWKESFDAINADGILHHLTDNDCRKLLECAVYYLKKGGFMLTVDTLKHQNQSKVERWLVSKDRGQNIKYPDEFINLVKPYFNTVETEILSNYLLIPYSTFRMKLTI